MDEKRERKEKGGKVGDNNRSLVGGEERVRGSPEHVTIIPSPGGVYVYTCRIGTGGEGGARGKAEHVTGLRNTAPPL